VKVVGAVALAALVLAGASASAAERAFPGRNGRIVFVSDRTSPRQPEIYAAAVAGGPPVNLSRNASWDSAPLPSPDGSRILFRCDRQGFGGLCVMAAGGGVARLLGNGEHPAWAPDGRSIAFEDGLGRIAVRDLETGAIQTVARGSLPSWSPDGRRIAFVGFGRGAEVHVVGVDGAGERHLVPGLVMAGVIVDAPAWSPNGARIAFAGGEVDQNGSARSSEVYVAALADGTATRLTEGGGAKSAPSWSPDGRSLVFVRQVPRLPGSELGVVAAAGGPVRRLTQPRRWEYDDVPVWSPDGGWIAYARGPADTTLSAVYVVRPDGRGSRRLSPAHSGIPAYEGPVWTPDGRRVLFARASSDRDPDLFSIEPDGTALRRVTNNDFQDGEPAWSPDGSRIGFVREIVTGPRTRPVHNDELFVTPANAPEERRLTHHTFEDLSPAWSPDGSRIAFVRRVSRGGLLAIYTIRAEGGGLRRLTSQEAFYSTPAWSPDGRRIAYTAGFGVGEGGALFVMDADGTGTRALPQVAELAVRPRWSPDGRAIVVGGITSCGRGCERTALFVVQADGSGFRKIADDVTIAAWSPDGKRLVLANGDLMLSNVAGTVRTPLTSGDASDALPDWQPSCTLTGSPRSDRLRGTAGDDLVCGRAGDDRLTGGRGRDRLFGAEGDDVVDARDGGFDVVGCGPGRDEVRADRADLVGEDCERVSRR
jgi:Tol biopolymer transport system component